MIFEGIDFKFTDLSVGIVALVEYISYTTCVNITYKIRTNRKENEQDTTAFFFSFCLVLHWRMNMNMNSGTEEYLGCTLTPSLFIFLLNLFRLDDVYCINIMHLGMRTKQQTFLLLFKDTIFEDCQ